MTCERVQQDPTGSHAREVGQQSLRAMIQSSFDAMVVVDRDGLVLFANPTAEQLLGRSAAELVGAQFGLPYMRGEAIEIEVGNTPRVAEMRVVEIEWEGRPAALALLRDLASRRLAALVEQSADAIFAFDHEGVITDWNRGAQRLLGHPPPDAIGRPVMMLVPENRSAQDSELHRRALAGQSVDYETKCVHADGTLVEVSMIISPIRATSGEVIAASAIARDVTEQNALVLRLSEAQYYTRSLIEASIDPMMTTDASGVITDVNQQMEALTAHTRAELIGTPFRDYVTEPERADEGIKRMLSDGSVRNFDLTVRSQDGRETPVSYNATTFPDREGTVQGVFAVARDITDRKRAEKELAHITSVLERTQEISKTGGWEYDVATGKLTWTDEVYRIYGVDRSSDPNKVTQAIAAYDPESAPIIEAAFERLVADGEPYDLEFGLIRADGERIWVRTIGQPVIEHGRVVRVNGNIADVTERNRNERALRQAREQLELAQRIAQLGSSWIDPGSGEMLWSAEMFRIFGRDPADGVPRAAELLACIYPEDRELVRAAYEGVLADVSRSELDFRVRAGDGAERVVHLIVSRDPNRSGLRSATVQDVTRVRAVERALREQSDRAESASHAKSEFLARMSHELRTPLNSILGFSQLLELEGLDPRHSEDVGYILKAGHHLLELVNEVLDLAQIESGQMTLSPEPVALADAIRDALALLAPTARECHVSLHVDTDGLADDGHVYADRHCFQQVLLNVLSNAIKYNRPGGRVDISFELTDARVRTIIADTGIGIQPEHCATLFTPFERLGAELTEVEGTGLGLSLSKGLVEAMGGTIEVDSTPGAGSTFVIELAEAEPPAKQHQPSSDRELAELGGPGASRKLILYIEDNLSNLTLVSRILARHDGIELISAMQGTLGLELARQHHPDLIVLDLHLPDISGIDVLKRVKADQPEVPVIVLTADASERQAENARRLGAADYLTKPLDVPGFLDAITTNLKPQASSKPPPQAPA